MKRILFARSGIDIEVEKSALSYVKDLEKTHIINEVRYADVWNRYDLTSHFDNESYFHNMDVALKEMKFSRAYFMITAGILDMHKLMPEVRRIDRQFRFHHKIYPSESKLTVSKTQ